MAVALGRLTGMGQDDLDTLFVAGMLHDIGKLGIPLALLSQYLPTQYQRVRPGSSLCARRITAGPRGRLDR